MKQLTKLVVESRKLIAIVMGALALGIAGVYFFTVARASTAQGSLSLQVTEGAEYRVGQSDPILVPVMLNTDGADIHGVDISLTYSPSILRLTDIVVMTENSTLKTVLPQVAGSGAFDKTRVLSQAQETGLVQFSVLAQEGQNSGVFRGSALVATLQFAPIAEGTAELVWNAVLGRTDDANIVATGSVPVDILTQPASASLQVLAAIPATPVPTATSVPTATPVPTATRTPTVTVAPLTPTFTPVPPTATSVPTSTPPTPTLTPSGQTRTATYYITSGGDDVYQDTSVVTNDRTVWVGRGQRTRSFLGLRFQNIQIPRNALITDAYVEMNAAGDSWISVDVRFAFENSPTSAIFTSNASPSKRTLTSQTARMQDNVQWRNNTWYRTPNLSASLQQLVSAASWRDNANVSIIGVGSGTQWARKQITSYEGNASRAARLVVTYRTP